MKQFEAAGGAQEFLSVVSGDPPPGGFYDPFASVVDVVPDVRKQCSRLNPAGRPEHGLRSNAFAADCSADSGIFVCGLCLACMQGMQGVPSEMKGGGYLQFEGLRGLSARRPPPNELPPNPVDAASAALESYEKQEQRLQKEEDALVKSYMAGAVPGERRWSLRKTPPPSNAAGTAPSGLQFSNAQLVMAPPPPEKKHSPAVSSRMRLQSPPRPPPASQPKSSSCVSRASAEAAPEPVPRGVVAFSSSPEGSEYRRQSFLRRLRLLLLRAAADGRSLVRREKPPRLPPRALGQRLECGLFGEEASQGGGLALRLTRALTEGALEMAREIGRRLSRVKAAKLAARSVLSASVRRRALRPWGRMALRLENSDCRVLCVHQRKGQLEPHQPKAAPPSSTRFGAHGERRKSSEQTASRRAACKALALKEDLRRRVFARMEGLSLQEGCSADLAPREAETQVLDERRRDTAAAGAAAKRDECAESFSSWHSASWGEAGRDSESSDSSQASAPPSVRGAVEAFGGASELPSETTTPQQRLASTSSSSGSALSLCSDDSFNLGAETEAPPSLGPESVAGGRRPSAETSSPNDSPSAPAAAVGQTTRRFLSDGLGASFFWVGGRGVSGEGECFEGLAERRRPRSEEQQTLSPETHPAAPFALCTPRASSASCVSSSSLDETLHSLPESDSELLLLANSGRTDGGSPLSGQHHAGGPEDPLSLKSQRRSRDLPGARRASGVGRRRNCPFQKPFLQEGGEGAGDPEGAMSLIEGFSSRSGQFPLSETATGPCLGVPLSNFGLALNSKTPGERALPFEASARLLSEESQTAEGGSAAVVSSVESDGIQRKQGQEPRSTGRGSGQGVCSKEVGEDAVQVAESEETQSDCEGTGASTNSRRHRPPLMATCEGGAGGPSLSKRMQSLYKESTRRALRSPLPFREKARLGPQGKGTFLPPPDGATKTRGGAAVRPKKVAPSFVESKQHGMLHDVDYDDVLYSKQASKEPL